jgi:predicted MFS family arabinose efflux permease
MGVALALLNPALSLMATLRVAPEERGAGLGVYLASMDIAFGVGPLIGGLIVSGASSATALWSGAAVALLAVPLVLAAAR